MVHRCVRLAALCLMLLLIVPQATPSYAHQPPVLTLPTPRGETWKVIQGYNCGSHDGWGRLSFDLVNNNGRTRGAPVYAAADGTLWYWGARSGTLIISHGGGYYTMYTHMQSHIDLPRGAPIARGAWIGSVGNVGAPYTVPHLHFTFFYGEGSWARNRRPLPLKFAEGYDFPDEGICNNHAGALLTANGQAAEQAAPAITWRGQPEQAWSAVGNISWEIQDSDALGFSFQWDAEPGGDGPAITAGSGSAALSEPGKRTIFVRAWDRAGHQTLASRQVWYDPQPPVLPAAEIEHWTFASSEPVLLRWQPAADALSGVKGYQLYTGPDQNGESSWFTTAPEVNLGQLSPGHFYLRVRAQDQAGNFSPWATIAVVEVR